MTALTITPMASLEELVPALAAEGLPVDDIEDDGRGQCAFCQHGIILGAEIHGGGKRRDGGDAEPRSQRCAFGLAGVNGQWPCRQGCLLYTSPSPRDS